MEKIKVIDEKVLPSLGGFKHLDYLKIKNKLSKEDIKIETFLQNHYNEEKVMYAIQSLLKKTELTDDKFLNYIKLAINSKYSYNFLLQMFYLFKRNGLKLYSVSLEILMSLIKNDYEEEECIHVLNYLYQEGYNQAYVANQNGDNILEILKDNEKYKYFYNLFLIMQRNAGRYFTKDTSSSEYIDSAVLKDKIRKEVLPKVIENDDNYNAQVIDRAIGKHIYINKKGSNLLFFVTLNGLENISEEEEDKILITLKTLLNTTFLNPNQINEKKLSFVNFLAPHISVYKLIPFIEEIEVYGWDFDKFACDILIDYFNSNINVADKEYLVRAFLSMGYKLESTSLRYGISLDEYINAKISEGDKWHNDLKCYEKCLRIINREERCQNNKVTHYEGQEELQKYGTIYNNLNFTMNPAIGRDAEVENTIRGLLKEKTSPILVGPPGVGKTAIAKSIAFRINKGEVPELLKGRLVVGISPNSLLAGTKYRGELEEKMEHIMKSVKKYNAILFIDEIQSLDGAGSSIDDNNNLAEMLKQYIEKLGITVIGTTTIDAYNTYFLHSKVETGYKRRFSPIMVDEPDDTLLTTIVSNVLDDYCLRNDIYFSEDMDKDDIISILIQYTSSKCQNVFDREYNPSLVVSIIDSSFASTKYRDDNIINIDDFICGFRECKRISEPSKNKAISALQSLENKKGIKRTRANIINVDFVNKQIKD